MHTRAVRVRSARIAVDEVDGVPEDTYDTSERLAPHKEISVLQEFDWMFAHPQFGTTGLEDDTFGSEALAADAARAADGSLVVSWDDGDLTIDTYSGLKRVRKQLAKTEATLVAAKQGTGAIADVNMFWPILLHKKVLVERYVKAGGATGLCALPTRA